MEQAVNKTLDIEKIRKDFPILQTEVHGNPLVYLDNAATTQKPQVVLDALNEYYSATNANIHRGIHYLAEKATAQYEETRKTVQSFLNADRPEEIIFTRGTTEAINLVANTFGRQNVGAGDEVIISTMEHHSNIVPWQMLCEEKGATLKVIPITDKGEIIFEEYEALLSEKTKLVAVNYASNTLGTINPVKQIIEKAHAVGAKVLIDGAQATSHLTVDVQALDCDFYTLSAHKMYGPTGVGALYGKYELLDSMPPYQGGGEMIAEVSFEKTTYNVPPFKFEAGTPNIGGVVAFKAALDYIQAIGRPTIAAYEQQLLDYATPKFAELEGLRLIGQAENKVSVLSFVFDDVHHQDLGIMLDTRGIAIRTGHHCTQPLMDRLGIPGTNRASFAIYNTEEEIDKTVEAIKGTLKMFR